MKHSSGLPYQRSFSSGTVFQYNEADGNVGDPGDHDRGNFDADYKSKGTIIQYNDSHGNHGFASIMKKTMTGTIIRYNLSVNDLYSAYHYGFENDSAMTDTKIYNNTHYFQRSLSPELIGGRTAKSGMKREPINNFPLFCEVARLTGSPFFDSLKNGFSPRRQDRKDQDRKEWLRTIVAGKFMRLGYLLNFGEAMMKTGITRTVNGLPE